MPAPVKKGTKGGPAKSRGVTPKGKGRKRRGEDSDEEEEEEEEEQDENAGHGANNRSTVRGKEKDRGAVGGKPGRSTVSRGRRAVVQEEEDEEAEF